MSGDLPPPRLTYAELEGLALSLADRVLMLEAGLRAPLSILDRTMAKAMDEERWAPHRAFERRVEMLNKAKAEAERAAMAEAADDFTRRLMAGEFDQYRQ
jgi:hypothetical protein